MIKVKSIKLNRAINMDKSEVGKPVYHYKVVQVTDSLDYPVGEFITAEQADKLCLARDWKVTVA